MVMITPRPPGIVRDEIWTCLNWGVNRVERKIDEEGIVFLVSSSNPFADVSRESVREVFARWAVFQIGISVRREIRPGRSPLKAAEVDIKAIWDGILGEVPFSCDRGLVSGFFENLRHGREGSFENCFVGNRNDSPVHGFPPI